MAKAAAKTKPKKEYKFKWEGTDQKGNKVTGTTMGPSEATVKQEIRRKGVIPVKVNRESALAGLGKGKKITAGDIAIFSRQMATMMSSGVPLVQSFEIIGRGSDNPKFRELLQEIREDIESGTNLADALAAHPQYFDKLYINLVRSGEQSGALEALLDKIATYKEKTEALKAKIKKALFYPTAVMIVAFIVTAILLIYVVPQFEELFAGFGADLPAFTRFVIDLSEFAQTRGWLVVIGMVAVGSGFVYLKKRSPGFQRAIDRMVLKIPQLGPIMQDAAVARFSRTLATMFSAGVPLVEALESVAGATGNVIYEEAILKMRDQVATGQQLNVAMNEAGLFPSMVTQMIAIGEEAGSIDTMAGKVADFYEERVDNAVDSLSSLLEPLIMAILGVLVGGLVIAMYLPIFQLGSVV
ncbi:type II secretion system F family protein [Natronospira bacteriovora]|uniref:Type II secretion system F family protein n=1 Tax=Natronospira bacteriovora TaxID=3069753 RepID=A0ABU0W641_9GAMM|nr:type II secretion system F family protein [Natronospira sp. AB-CW4]MDQ2069491.1 type II secretion system F family protein [Natronospira sp. AB-CW4]